MEKFLWIAGALSAFLLCNSHSSQQIDREQAELFDPCIRSVVVADPTEAENGMKNDLSVERKERCSIFKKGSLHVRKSPVGRRFRTQVNAFTPSSCDNVGNCQLDIENESCNESSGPLGYRADPDNCQKFYQCANGKWVSKDCPAGLAWNTETATCDWPRNVPECNFAS